MAACVLTFSRTGWFGMTVGVVAILVSQWRVGRARLKAAAKLLALATVAGSLFLGVVVATDPRGVGGDVLKSIEFRLAYLGVLGQIDLGVEGVVDPDLVVPDNRLEVWGEYWKRFGESPVRGIGLGRGWGEHGLQEPHNLWLELLAEMGLVGLLGFGVLLVSVGRWGDEAVTSVLVVIGLATLSQTVLFEPVLWFALGLVVAARERRTTPEPMLAAA
jgi:O-antigen ligase